MAHRFHNNLTGGEWLPFLWERSDLAKHDSAARCLENFRPLPYGGLRYRAGFAHVAPFADPVRLMPFYRGDAGRFLLAWRHRRLAIFEGDKLVAELDSPYPLDALFRVHCRQINDVVYLVHPAHPPHRLEWHGAEKGWKLFAVAWDFPALRDDNTGPVKLTLTKAEDGSYALAASNVPDDYGPVFAAGHVGAYWVLRHPKASASVALSLSTDEAAAKYYRKEIYLQKINGGRGSTVTTREAVRWVQIDKATYDGITDSAWKKATGTKFIAEDEEVRSGEILIRGPWTISTSQTWRGTLYVERKNAATGDWDIVRSFEGNSDRNISGSGLQEKEAAFRLRYISGGDPFGKDVYVGTKPTTYVLPNATLECEEAVVDSIVRVVSVEGPQEATVEAVDVKDAAIGEPTADWSEGAWSAYRGFPGTVAFHEQRLYFGGTDAQPNGVWGSCIDEFHDFRLGANDTDAVMYVLAASEQNRIAWMESMAKLQITTSGREFTLGSGRFEDPITATNVSVRTDSANGATPVQPAVFDRSVLFAGRQGKTLLEMAYDLQADGFRSVELSLLARHITDAGIVQIAKANLPDTVAFIALGDGTLAALTYDRDQNVTAWARWLTRGKFRSVAVLRGEVDAVYAVVERERLMVPDVGWRVIYVHGATGNDAADGLSDLSPVKSGGRVNAIFRQLVADGAQAIEIRSLSDDAIWFLGADETKVFAGAGVSLRITSAAGQCHFSTGGGGGFVVDVRYFLVVTTSVWQCTNGSQATAGTATLSLTAEAGMTLTNAANPQGPPLLRVWGMVRPELGLRLGAGGHYNFALSCYNFDVGVRAQECFAFLSWRMDADSKARSNGTYMVADAATVSSFFSGTLYTGEGNIISAVENGGIVSIEAGVPPVPTPPAPAPDFLPYWSVERLTPERDDKLLGNWLDGSAVYDCGDVEIHAGIPFTPAGADKLLALYHGQTVTVVVDGRVFERVPVEGSALVLPRDCPHARKLTVGSPYAGRLQTMKADAMLQDGGTQGRRRKVSRVMPRFWRTVGGRYGNSFTDMHDINFRMAGDNMDATTPEFTGDLPQLFDGTFDRSGSVCLEQDQPLPWTLLGLDVDIDFVT